MNKTYGLHKNENKTLLSKEGEEIDEENGEERPDNEEHTSRKNKLVIYSKLLERETTIRDLNKEIVALREKVAKQRKKLSGKESTIRNLNSEVAYHKNEVGKKRKQIEKLKKTIDNKNEHNKSIKTEKEILKLDLTNKSITRCTDTI